MKVIWFCLRKTISGSYLKQNNSDLVFHVGGQEYALQHGGQYKSYYFVKKSTCRKISPLNAFPLKFRVEDYYFVCALSIFGISKIPTHCLKGALVTWPLSASGLFHFLKAPCSSAGKCMGKEGNLVSRTTYHSCMNITIQSKENKNIILT